MQNKSAIHELIGRKLIVIIIIQAHCQFMHLQFTSMVLILQCKRNIFTKVAETQSESQWTIKVILFFAFFGSVRSLCNWNKKGKEVQWCTWTWICIWAGQDQKKNGVKIKYGQRRAWWDNRDLHKFMQLTYDTEITQFGQRLKVSARNRNSKNTQHRQQQT